MPRFATSATHGRLPYALPWKTTAHEGRWRCLAAVAAFSFRCPPRLGRLKGETHGANIQEQLKRQEL